MSTSTDTRAVTLVDLPLLRRLTGSGIVLDSEVGLTRDARGPHSLLLSSLIFSRGLYTFVSRSDVQPVVGQFRYRPDDINAHIVYLAPTLEASSDDTVWLHTLDAMAREAGKHGAHALVAEVETSSNLFETLRTARFATYARQVIWRHDPITGMVDTVGLADETSDDQLGVMSLISNTVPKMLQQVATPSSDMDGLVYRKDGRVEAHIAVSEGAHGVYLLPHLHPDLLPEAADIITSAIATVERASKVPVYVCVRMYQNWLDSALETLDFECYTEQAVMVKQLVAGIKHPSFARLSRIKGKLEVSCAPNHWSIRQNAKDKDSHTPYGTTDKG